ncbi:olfactory receptor 14J1-like [Suncus etruscus]|uniref:olfactory receptor 14J1-like n=1 Tax=Suncus etruscus TaxID=109475 RepID=UPI0021109327|nr:olfactory receptor 14J1-like [Suncus etruscus]
MANFTISDFILMGFSAKPEIEILYASLFLILYLLALTGNILIITTTSVDESLNSPMYFFLKHLSFLDLCNISVTIPRFIYNSFMQSGIISFWECIVQCFALVMCVSAELAMLTVMSYDRYVAICLPLHYDIIMNVRTCLRGVIGVWVSGTISGVMHTAATFSIRFCGPPIIHQFFCDVLQILKLSCSNEYIGDAAITIFLSLVAFSCFIFIAFSYMHIFSSVLRMSSLEGRAKAFSTCLPHLAVVILFITTAAFEFLKPRSKSSTALDILFTILYTIVPPTLNPMIYSLRNKTIQMALGKVARPDDDLVNPDSVLRKYSQFCSEAPMQCQSQVCKVSYPCSIFLVLRYNS